MAPTKQALMICISVLRAVVKAVFDDDHYQMWDLIDELDQAESLIEEEETDEDQ